MAYQGPDGHSMSRYSDGHAAPWGHPGYGKGYPGYPPAGYIGPHHSYGISPVAPPQYGNGKDFGKGGSTYSRPGWQEQKRKRPREQAPEKIDVRNDYCQEYVDSGHRPQNYLRDLPLQQRFSEYPKLQKVLQLKQEVIQKRATPAMSLKTDLKTFDLTQLGTRFDVILIDPPWEEYHNRVTGTYVHGEDLAPWTLDEIANLRIGDIAEETAFCLLWCGVSHLEQARVLFKRWNFRRCEDICWIKTNHNGASYQDDENSIICRTKEHCLLGIKGNVKRSNDAHIIHANIDTDVIIDEQPEVAGSTRKPLELYQIIENFALCRRRLELFGTDHNIRDGWLTVGNAITRSNWNRDLYSSWFQGDKCYPEVTDYRGGKYLGTLKEIEAIRPRSPKRTTALEDARPVVTKIEYKTETVEYKPKDKRIAIEDQ